MFAQHCDGKLDNTDAPECGSQHGGIFADMVGAWRSSKRANKLTKQPSRICCSELANKHARTLFCNAVSNGWLQPASSVSHKLASGRDHAPGSKPDIKPALKRVRQPAWTVGSIPFSKYASLPRYIPVDVHVCVLSHSYLVKLAGQRAAKQSRQPIFRRARLPISRHCAIRAWTHERQHVDPRMYRRAYLPACTLAGPVEHPCDSRRGSRQSLFAALTDGTGSDQHRYFVT